MTLSDPTSYVISIEVSAAEHVKLSERATRQKMTVAELVKQEALRGDVHPVERVVQTVRPEVPEDGGKKK